MEENSFNKRPSVTPFVECPNCGRLLEYGAERCQSCREEIGEGYAQVSAAVVMFNTQAISLANTIKGGDPAAIIIIFSSLVAYLFDVYDSELPRLWLWGIVWAGTVIPLLAILVWFINFAWFRKIADEEFVQTMRGMRASLSLWLALLALQIIACATLS